MAVGGDAARIIPFHESRIWERFPSREFSDGLHLAEVSVASGHGGLPGPLRGPEHDSGGTRTAGAG
jgi:hypothetical protein